MIEITEPMLIIIAMYITLAMLSLMAAIDARSTKLATLRVMLPITGMLSLGGLIPILKYSYSESVAMYCVIVITITVVVITYLTLVFEDSKMKKR